MKSAYLMAAMPSEVFLRLLMRNGAGLHPTYLSRCAFILQSGLWSSFLAWREKRIFGDSIAAAPVPNDPLIILNHWRTGSTLLHQLIDCHEQFVAPTLYQITYPTSFMSSRRYVEPIMKRMLLPKRPMDNVPLGMDMPEEEEGALFRMCGLSPTERLLFPRNGDYFLLEDETFLPGPARQKKWDAAFLRFVRTLAFHSGRRPVLKNPFHSLRIPALLRLFPEAKFIHIYRDPRIVIPSTVRMWSIVGAQNAMNSRWRPPAFEQVVTVFDRMMNRINTHLSSLPSHRWAEVKFEDLEQDATGAIAAAFERLQLEYSGSFEHSMKQYWLSVSAYEKNDYALSDNRRGIINSRLAQHVQRGGYA